VIVKPSELRSDLAPRVVKSTGGMKLLAVRLGLLRIASIGSRDIRRSSLRQGFSGEPAKAEEDRAMRRRDVFMIFFTQTRKRFSSSFGECLLDVSRARD